MEIFLKPKKENETIGYYKEVKLNNLTSCLKQTNHLSRVKERLTEKKNYRKKENQTLYVTIFFHFSTSAV